MKQYYVIQEFSWTDIRCLWRVFSRPMRNILSAQNWLDSEKSRAAKTKRNKRREWFIVERLSDEEVQRRIDTGEQFE